jgi:Predicted integral membrane protein
MDFRKLRNKLIAGIFFGAVVMTVLAVWADFAKLKSVLLRFSWGYLPVIFVCVMLGYLGRFLKWQLYMRTLRIDISAGLSARIFFSGLSMAVTPGKVGEVMKSFLLQRTHGVDVVRTAPTVFAERLTDLMAMLFLAGVGAGVLAIGKEFIAIGVACTALLIGLVQYQPLAEKVLDLLARLPWLEAHGPKLRHLYDSAYLLIQGRLLVATFVISVTAWFMECLALYLIFKGYGLSYSLLEATFVLSLGSIIGGASMLPGGLGAAEGSMLGLLVYLGADRTLATGATLLVRFGTLWFGVIGGFTILALSWRKFGLQNIEAKSLEKPHETTP